MARSPARQYLLRRSIVAGANLWIARNWNTGDSAAREYGRLVPMVECRNLTQLGEFVHDLA